jgi:hypothetical protein
MNRRYFRQTDKVNDCMDDLYTIHEYMCENIVVKNHGDAPSEEQVLASYIEMAIRNLDKFIETIKE